MISFSSFSRSFLRPITAACLFSLAVIDGRAQGKNDLAPAQVLATHRTAQETAKSAANRGDFTAAAQALDALSTAPVNSAARSFETAQRLTTLASTLSRAGNGAGAQAAASTALQYLADATRRTNDSELKAAIQGQTGFLQERYLGDVAAAKASYRAAAQLAPGNAAAREKADKFESADNQARGKANKNR